MKTSEEDFFIVEYLLYEYDLSLTLKNNYLKLDEERNIHPTFSGIWIYFTHKTCVL